MISIVLADDHDIVRDGLKMLLELEEEFEIVGTASTGREALELCRVKNPHVIVLDLDMPDMDGMDVAKQLQSESSPVKIIILTMHCTEKYAVRLLINGVSAFVPKNTPGDELPGIIRQVMTGKTFVPEDMREAVISNMVSQSRKKSPELTDRELQVFAAYAKGKERAEIANSLHISPRTVDAHKQNIMEKLGSDNMADLIKAAIREGVIDKY